MYLWDNGLSKEASCALASKELISPLGFITTHNPTHKTPLLLFELVLSSPPNSQLGSSIRTTCPFSASIPCCCLRQTHRASICVSLLTDPLILGAGMEGASLEKLRIEDCSNLPPGFRFYPTDAELIDHYLVPKVMDGSFAAVAIGEVDLNSCEPWDLPKKAKTGENELYFYCLRDRKYPTGMKTNRATKAGFWKATGKDKKIWRDKGTLVGLKKTLVFHTGRAPKGKKTNWIMHEYRLAGKSWNLPKFPKCEWVVCRIFNKKATKEEETPQEFAPPTKPRGNGYGPLDILPPLKESPANMGMNRNCPCRSHQFLFQFPASPIPNSQSSIQVQSLVSPLYLNQKRDSEMISAPTLATQCKTERCTEQSQTNTPPFNMASIFAIQGIQQPHDQLFPLGEFMDLKDMWRCNSGHMW